VYIRVIVLFLLVSIRVTCIMGVVWNDYSLIKTPSLNAYKFKYQARKEQECRSLSVSNFAFHRCRIFSPALPDLALKLKFIIIKTLFR